MESGKLQTTSSVMMETSSAVMDAATVDTSSQDISAQTSTQLPATEPQFEGMAKET